jgi:outer membrane protein assembly factor BamB
MTRLLGIWRAWSVRTRVLLIAGLATLVAGGAVAAYLILKRDSDVECPPPCELEVEKPPRKKETVKTVNWPVYGYDDQRTRYLPTERVRPPYDASIWSFNAGKLLEFSPVIGERRLFFQDKNSLFYALEADTGKVAWKNEIGDLAASSPAYADGRVFAVTLEPGSAVALRAKDGKRIWERPLPGRSETSPLVYGKSVIVGSESGDVFALDQKDGDIRWQASTDGNVKGGLALDDGVLYGANYAGQVFAIKASSGEYVWQSSTQGLSFGRGGPVYSTTAVAFGRVYLGSIDTRVYSFDQDTGELLWSHSTGDWVYAAPALADTPKTDPTVYVGSKDQNLYALDAKTGEVRWQQRIGGVILGAASVLGETVYVAGLGPNIGTYGFNVKTGKETFESELGEYNPVISDGHYMYLTGASGIRAFEHETAAEQRREAKRRRAERQRQDAAHRAKRKRQEAAHRAKRKRQEAAHEAAKKDEQQGNKGKGSKGG